MAIDAVTTSSRANRASRSRRRGIRRSHSEPPSRSYMAIACGSSYEASPELDRRAGRPRRRRPRSSGTSTPASSDSLYCPRLYSPKSSAARHTQFPSGSAYGTKISSSAMRWMIGRTTPCILEADLVEDEALARVEADAEVPAHPLDRVAREREARTVGLDDIERLQPGTGRVGAAREGRVHGLDARVGDVDDRQRVHVDRRDHALDRAVVRVRQATVEERQARAAASCPAGLRRQRDRSRGPHVDVDVSGLQMPRSRIALRQRASRGRRRRPVAYSLMETAGWTPGRSTHEISFWVFRSTTASNSRLAARL